jgi:hypothetical protein
MTPVFELAKTLYVLDHATAVIGGREEYRLKRNKK